ncbi:DUF547 domain-containing protein [Aquimarina spongiae]|uniref:DUF547 domain-containing protein n=1 Tax=Aquimarina spongiae TaxID=570521 RepID=A0A1M6KSX0_9FLAO|nr:DUF547 domain-containing protein [Aquimarina spongiae]SHJ61976.1 Protein of unknown function, DUF547 [Aquimarina spongiae]
MNRVLFMLLVGMSFSCTTSKAAIQTTQETPIAENITAEKDTDSPDIVVIEEKAADTIIPEEIKEEKSEDVIPITDSIPKTTKEKQEPIKAVTENTSFDHKPWNILLGKYISKDGMVNYKGFKQNGKAFRAYLTSLSNNPPKQSWSKNEKLAYWLNVYNAFTVKLIIDNYPLASIKDIKDPWDLRFFRIGKKWYTLNDVEHRMLRKMGDPRIHFGINCASYSCPALSNKAFTAQNVNQELERLTIAFINDTSRNQISKDKIEISKIFSWFAKDFKKEGTIIDFLNKYSKVTISNTAKKSFLKYDWALNE